MDQSKIGHCPMITPTMHSGGRAQGDDKVHFMFREDVIMIKRLRAMLCALKVDVLGGGAGEGLQEK